jgi:hypothetical protein
MKTITVLAAFIMGFCLNLSAQNRAKPNLHFAAYKTFTAAVSLPNFENSEPFLGGYFMEIAENKARKTFAELSDLGESFYAPLALEWGRVELPEKHWEKAFFTTNKSPKYNQIPPIDPYGNPDLDK